MLIWVTPFIPMSATQLIGDMEVLARLQKELDKLRKETCRLKDKLSNEKFISNAPADVVAKEQEKLAEAEKALVKLQEQYGKIEAL